MSDEKSDDRSRRNKRRLHQAREEGARNAAMAKAAHAESKVSDEKLKLNLRIGKLLKQGYSKPSIAKRLNITLWRIESAMDALR